MNNGGVVAEIYRHMHTTHVCVWVMCVHVYVCVHTPLKGVMGYRYQLFLHFKV